MTLIHYEPWGLAGRLQRTFEQVLANTLARADAADASVAWIPSVDVHEEPERFVVRADLPGVDAKDIEITAEDGVLTLRGARGSEKTEQHDGVTRVERVAGRFLRRFTLPETAQTDAISAKQTNGVLEVSIPKQTKPEPRRIKIDAA
ncbi:MAG TPA: Hsp20/alpha crystallin family protein [Steroidobacteraceae bacterium]|nr:Hsp20/alpha crystallin family protein [Steroidobacteraceae bacterium]